MIVREKDLTEESYRSLADQVRQVCKRHDIPCIYHNFIQAAKKDHVQKIHLPLWKLRENKEWISKQFSVIGSSVHSIEEAIEAEFMGANYLIDAIGGIHLDRQQIEEVLECGAYGFCIMSELMKIDINIL